MFNKFDFLAFTKVQTIILYLNIIKVTTLYDELHFKLQSRIHQFNCIERYQKHFEPFKN